VEYGAAAGWEGTNTGWIAPKDDSPYIMKLLTLDEASNPVAYQTALWVAAAWHAIGLTVQVEAVPTFTYMERLNGGRFAAAIVTYEVGLDADLGPLLLSSQVGAGGSNVAGLQDQALDTMLMAVRKAVLPVARREAVAAVEEYISTMVPILPLVFRDYGLVVSDRVRGMTSSQIADPSGRFWDVIDWRLASAR
jgi:ABC-type transport system substrate-binding protein